MKLYLDSYEFRASVKMQRASAHKILADPLPRRPSPGCGPGGAGDRYFLSLISSFEGE